jgi:hypothetical protein
MVIQVLETVTKEEERKREGLGSVQPSFSSVWHTGLSGGAPGSVRCARLVRGELATLGIRRRCTTIIHRTTVVHRTIRWASGRQRQWSVAKSVDDAWQLQRSVGAPDCLVRQRARSCNSRLCPIWKGITHQTCYSSCPVAHRTVRCATRQKARIALHVDLCNTHFVIRV